MQVWNVTSENSSVSVESTGWLEALALALPQFQLSPRHMDRFVCVMNADGSVEVHEPQVNVRLRVTPAAQEHSRASAFPISSSLLAGDGAAPSDTRSPARRAPALEDSVVDLFDRCGEISAATNVRAACATALDIVQEFVPANAGAVLMITRDNSKLRFVAAFGPQAQKVVDSTLPVNHGIAGFIFDFPMGLIVEDVHTDARFSAGTDRSSGYATHSLLAVPVRSADGPVYGCLELLNSVDGFGPKDLETTQMIASALGAWLAGAQA